MTFPEGTPAILVNQNVNKCSGSRHKHSENGLEAGIESFSSSK